MSKASFTIDQPDGDDLTITVESELEKDYNGDVVAHLDLEAITDLLEPWVALASNERHFTWPGGTQRDDDDLIVAYIDPGGNLRVETIGTNEDNHWAAQDIAEAIWGLEFVTSDDQTAADQDDIPTV